MPNKKPPVADGLVLPRNSRVRHWWSRNRTKVEGNPAPIKKPVKHHPISLAAGVVAYCHTALSYAGKMVYDEWPQRAQLFSRKPGDFGGAHADCSQFVAAILHWLGVKTVTATDWTKTLLEKGKPLAKPEVGCVAVWGPGTGAHAAFITEVGKTAATTYCVGFGHQGAPDRSTLAGMNAYFESVGKPGVRYLWFAS